MKPTEQFANTASTPKTGLFATLRGLLHTKGTSAPKIARGTGASSTTRVLSNPVLRALPALVLASLAFTAAPALAAAPETPLTREAKSVTGTSAVLNGELNPDAAYLQTPGEEYQFEYAPSGSECTGGLVAPEPAAIAFGSEKEAVFRDVTGLEGSTEYTFCVVAIHTPLGEAPEPSPAAPLTFKTLPVKPVVVPASEKTLALTPFEATVEAEVNPEDQPTTSCVFEYGGTIGYGKSVPCAQSVLEGGSVTSASASFAGLKAATKYHYRVVVKNATGEAAGTGEFMTPVAGVPVVESESALGATSSAATVNAQVNPEYQATTCEFEYASSVAAIGHGASIVSCPESLGNGGGGVGVSVALIGLKAGETYYYRVLATNATGTVTGLTIEHFTTVPAPVAEAPSPIGATTATLKGKLTPLNLTVETEYFFQYNVGAACTGGTSTPVEKAGTGSGLFVVPSTPVTALEPNATYMVCLVASNIFGSETSAPVPFTTKAAPPEVLSEGASAVTPFEATLEAQVNPNNQKTTYKFEYSTSATGETLNAPITTLTGEAALEGYGGQTASVSTGHALASATTYHYRVIAENAKGETAEGKVEGFTTLTAEKPVIEAETASGMTPLDAKLEAQVNPNYQQTTIAFEYAEHESELLEVPSHGTKVPAASIPAGIGGQPVSVTLGNVLQQGTKYFYRVVATNATGTTENTGAIQKFQTLPAQAPSITNESFLQVGDHSANLTAQVNTENEKANYYYLYGTTSQFEAKEGQKTPEVALAASDQSVPATGEPTSLQPETEYHFVLVVTNENNEISLGETLTFHTLPLEASGLPDGRVFEMVMPVENHDAGVYVPQAIHGESSNEGLQARYPFQVADDGEAVTYMAGITVDGYGKAAENEGEQYLANRLPNGGWVQTESQPDGRPTTHYQGFSSNLITGILYSGGEPEPRLPPLSAQAPGAGYPVLYACDLTKSPCTTSEESTSAHTNPFQPISGMPLNRSAGEFGTEGYGEPGYGVLSDGKSASNEKEPVFAGSSETGDLLFEANDALIAGEGSLEKELDADVKREISKNEDTNYLYESVGGRLSLVDVLPNGEVAGNATFGARPFISGDAENNPPDFSGVISADGGLVFWTDLSTGVVYAREGGARTVQVSEGAARYWTSAEDGRFVFYSEAREGKGEALYRFNMVTAERELLADSSARLLGVVGASESCESVYFVAEGALGSAANSEGALPTEGEPNLYLLNPPGPAHPGGALAFIATLSRNDGNRVEPFHVTDFELEDGDWQPGLGQRTAEVAGSGGSVVFMSESPLPVVGYPHGYPNPRGFDEVYMFSAAANQLFCVSCGSSGEAPPASAKGAAAFLPVSWSDTYLPHWISENGDRVFFDSPVPLVPATRMAG